MGSRCLRYSCQWQWFVMQQGAFFWGNLAFIQLTHPLITASLDALNPQRCDREPHSPWNTLVFAGRRG
jgi:hypothetical protein